MTTLKSIPNRVLVTRVAMCGGGLSYDVLVPVKHVDHYDGCRYTTVCNSTGKYVRIEDALIGEEHFAMPLGWDRYQDTLESHKAAAAIAYQIAVQAFPELEKVGKVPTLWVTGLLPVETHSDKMIDPRNGKVVAEWRYEDGRAVKQAVTNGR